MGVGENYRLPEHRWQFQAVSVEDLEAIAATLDLAPTLVQILANRGYLNHQDIQKFIDPDTIYLPPPEQDFAGLDRCVELLHDCIVQRKKILICGDYDADGMTSTALFLRVLSALGADVSYSIPSRMQEGYGINRRMVEQAKSEDVSLLLTVDNGIAAHDPIALAKSLGLSVIITDHHELPPVLPDADVILNPHLLPQHSPYRGMAGVGVSYIVADALAKRVGQAEKLRDEALSLFTLGTIADLAPLVGVNRRWVRQGLKLLPTSPIEGVQALIQLCGLADRAQIQPEEIGFRLGPRINAVGRIASPQIIIDLFTTTDPGYALELAMQCEGINKQRQVLCEQIENEAVALCQQRLSTLLRDRVIVLVEPGWHHGVIGIVASRLVDRFGLPTFIGTYEEDEPGRVRGSARGIPEFNIMEALTFASDSLAKFGGHHAAGGFSLSSDQVDQFRQRLSSYACSKLEPSHLKPLLKIESHSHFDQLGLEMIEHLRHLQPCGIENPEPIFWAAQVEIVEQRRIGKNHLKFKLRQAGCSVIHEAIAWKWADYRLPSHIDIAFKLKINDWQGNQTPQLELVGARVPQSDLNAHIQFSHSDRLYTVRLFNNPAYSYLHIENQDGKALQVKKGQKMGVVCTPHEPVRPVDVRSEPFRGLILAALDAISREAEKSQALEL